MHYPGIYIYTCILIVSVIKKNGFVIERLCWYRISFSNHVIDSFKLHHISFYGQIISRSYIAALKEKKRKKVEKRNIAFDRDVKHYKMLLQYE